MRLSNNELYKAIRAGLTVGVMGLVGVAGAAIAQDSEERTLDRIEVTGSRIRQVDLETAQPVLTISREEIEAQGLTSVADILQSMTTAGTPPISRSSPLSSGENVGGVYIDMRNLGTNRTLVLVNGKRLGTTTAGLQDVSQIPTSIVERIEVLKDGASSIYGSDAISGVINIITRRNFTGAEVNAYYGDYTSGKSAPRQAYDFTIGMAGERGHVVMSAEYQKEEGLMGGDRWYTTDSYPGYPQYSWTTVGQYGRFLHNGTYWVANPGSDARTWDNFHPQDTSPGGDVSNSSLAMHIYTPMERKGAYVAASYDLADWVRFTTDVSYTHRQMEQQIAGYPFQSASSWAGGTIPNTHMSPYSYFNPVGFWGTGENMNPLTWTRRTWEIPRFTNYDADQWRFTGAFDGAFDIGDRYFMWDVGYMFTRSTQLQRGTGNLQPSRVAMAVGPSFLNAAGQVQCGTPDNPIPMTACVPWNPFAGFGRGGVANSLDDPAVVTFLFPEEHTTAETKTTNYYANLTGTLFTLPAGDLGFAVGYEYRREEGLYAPDALRQTGDHTSLASTTTTGKYSVDEFYAEFEIPLLAEIPGFQELSLNVAGRYSDYTTFGDTTNLKASLRWRPIEDLLVRATWAEGFRAPTISDLYGGGSQTFTTNFHDPCDAVFGDAAGTPRCEADTGHARIWDPAEWGGSGPLVYRQLQQGFIPTTARAMQTPVPFFSGSNPFLMPETSTSKTVGAVWSVGFVEGLNVGVDWWHYKIENTIVSDSPNLILQDCYVRNIESRCLLFTRDPVTGIVNNLTYGGRNSGYVVTEGWDWDVSYRFATDFGQFGIVWNNTYVSKLNSKTDLTQQYESTATSWGGNFRLRSNLSVNWDLGDWGVTWAARYYSSMKEECYFEDPCTDFNYTAPDLNGIITPMRLAGSNTFHDLQVRWNAPWGGTIAVGANNVTDHEGPVMYSGPNSNFSYYGGFDLGRMWYAKYKQTF